MISLSTIPYELVIFQNEKGWLSWLDVSIGKLVKQTSTKLGRLDVMCHNPYNAVLCAGHSKVFNFTGLKSYIDYSGIHSTFYFIYEKCNSSQPIKYFRVTKYSFSLNSSTVFSNNKNDIV